MARWLSHVRSAPSIPSPAIAKAAVILPMFLSCRGQDVCRQRSACRRQRRVSGKARGPVSSTVESRRGSEDGRPSRGMTETSRRLFGRAETVLVSLRVVGDVGLGQSRSHCRRLRDGRELDIVLHSYSHDPVLRIRSEIQGRWRYATTCRSTRVVAIYFVERVEGSSHRAEHASVQKLGREDILCDPACDQRCQRPSSLIRPR